MEVLGIDIGGSGIKGAPVNVDTGVVTAERFRVETPQPATPKAIAAAINELIAHFNWKGPVGIGFPAAIHRGVIMNATNIDKSWIGTDANKFFTKATKNPTYVLNDADAAGLAEMRFGEGKGCKGVVIAITVGTGVGTALFTDGVLVPNTELGHIYFDNVEAERYVSDATRKKEDLSWGKWSLRFCKYLVAMEKLFYPELFIIGGGVSKKADKFQDGISVKTKVVISSLQNHAGIIGAACFANESNV